MNEVIQKARVALPHKWSLTALILISVAWLIWPDHSLATIIFVINDMIEVTPLVIPGILVSAWVNASGAGDRIKNAFEGNRTKAIFISALVGAITPVCGITVLPLMAGLLASGVPLAPVMAFWLSSPVTDPAMFAVTAATLGFHFAVFKTLAAFGIGIFGGLTTAGMKNLRWTQQPLRQGGLAAIVSVQSTCAQTTQFERDIWKSPERMQQFWKEVWAMTRLIVICLGLAFAAEFLMQSHLHPEALSRYVGSDTGWAIPLAVFVGSPAYLDGYAALPLTRGLIDHGMSLGAAMAFLVSGSVVSIWGALAIFPVLKSKPFMLYLFLAITGSLSVGWIYEYVS
jgi:uncharacterized membrane protein YraQ (UPF0718 family)